MKNYRALLVIGLLLLQAGVYYTISAKEYIPDIGPWSRFPAQVQDWRATADEPVDAEALATLKPDDYLNRDYISGKNQTLNLFVGYFNSRRNGRAPHSPEWCLPGAGWKTVSTRVVSIDTGIGSPLPANEYIVEKAGERQLVVYWYHQGERVLSSEVLAQFYAIPDMVLHGRTDTSLVRIIAPVVGDRVDGARSLAFQFARDVYPLIRRQIK
ncbi:MAG TPA: EpsI family protein [Bryobacteraceae bacterium]|jgi:EpsI family protein|nr:EpsI family protein [Bryobacteraceae bacterium]